MTAPNTPGPWIINGETDMLDLDIRAGAVGPVIARVYSNHDGLGRTRSDANARLIAAAPDMLEALMVALVRVESVARLFPDTAGFLDSTATDLRAAIAKARDGGLRS